MRWPKLDEIIGAVLAAGINLWVRATGRRVTQQAAPWLRSPAGDTGRIGAAFYDRLARREGLCIRPFPEASLLQNLDALTGSTFDPAAVDAAIRDFYEHTAAYRLEAWSEAGLPTRIFLWALTRFVSRRMDQLNFPVSSLELAGGMTSHILPMVDAAGRRAYTGWLRQLAADGRVIYTGLYAVETPGGFSDPCVKVSFPVPHGSATVFLRPEAGRDGSLRLISAGDRFGEPGFYRMIEVDAAHWRVRYIRTLRERFEVYRDRGGILRCEHTVWFLGLRVLRLAYKMERVQQADAQAENRIH